MDEEEEKRLRKKLGIPDPPPAVSGLLNAFKEPDASQASPVVYKRSTRLLLMGFLLPVAFMVATVLNLTLAPELIARKLIAIVSFLWPFAAPNYEWMKVHSSEMTAINYAIFLAAMLIYFCAFMIVSFKEIDSQPEDKRPAVGNILTLLVIGGFLYFFLQDLNVVKPVRKARYDFAIDPNGFYYLHQFMLIFAGSIFVFALPHIAHWIFGRSTPPSKE